MEMTSLNRMVFLCVFPVAKFEPLIWLNNPRADTILGVPWLDTAFFGGGLTPPPAGAGSQERSSSASGLRRAASYKSAVKPAHSKELSCRSIFQHSQKPLDPQ